MRLIDGSPDSRIDAFKPDDDKESTNRFSCSLIGCFLASVSKLRLQIASSNSNEETKATEDGMASHTAPIIFLKIASAEA
ncbi:MAG: hypothetical protein U0103_01430 [Candidatus Obscuribacterales bacterium]